MKNWILRVLGLTPNAREHIAHLEQRARDLEQHIESMQKRLDRIDNVLDQLIGQIRR